MRSVRLLSSAILLLSVGAVPAFAALPPATTPTPAPALELGFRPTPSLFGTQEIFHGDTSPFRQWTNMLTRANAQFATISASCPNGRSECAASEWSRLVAQLTPLPAREKVERANAILNTVPYVPSARNWGRASFWETPLEFLTYGGQCQDYAIAKYLLLRQAGIPAEQMRVVVLRATALGEDHAVLVVYVDGDALLLDNLHAGVVPASSETSYRPYYSINENGWWQHVAPNVILTAQR
jgi:predicted transglutaminase-like cysteine proteinase